MALTIHVHLHGIDDHGALAKVLAALTRIEGKIDIMADNTAATQAAVEALTADVANLTTVEQSAVAAINGLAAQLAAAIASASDKGATDAQLAALNDLHTAITGDASELAAAVAANTPAAPTT